MGVCASCLGGHRRDSITEDDESRLLFDDPNNMQYGSFGEQQMTGHDDPLEAQREIEALQRVVARTSDNMVDIFEIAPSQPQQDATGQHITSAGAAGPTPYALAGQEARLMRYQNLLSKLGNSAAEEEDDDYLEDGVAARVDWLPPDDAHADETVIEMRRSSVVPPATKTESALVGGFREAAAAMA